MIHLIPLTLREFRYYERKLPLYLRNDECFIEHFKLWYELLMGKGDDDTNIAINEFCGVSPTSDLLLYLLNIYDDNFLNVVSQLYNYNGKCDLLDELGNLFGLRRSFSFKYYDVSSARDVKTSVSLTDSEFLTLIKAQIIRNYCDGTYEQVMQYYADAKLQILPINSSVYNASADAYLNKIDELTDNLTKLFKGGFLTIEHLGIRYSYTILKLFEILIWSTVDGLDGNGVWADNSGNGGIFIV